MSFATRRVSRASVSACSRWTGKTVTRAGEKPPVRRRGARGQAGIICLKPARRRPHPASTTFDFAEHLTAAALRQGNKGADYGLRGLLERRGAAGDTARRPTWRPRAPARHQERDGGHLIHGSEGSTVRERPGRRSARNVNLPRPQTPCSDGQERRRPAARPSWDSVVHGGMGAVISPGRPICGGAGLEPERKGAHPREGAVARSPLRPDAGRGRDVIQAARRRIAGRGTRSPVLTDVSRLRRAGSARTLGGVGELIRLRDFSGAPRPRGQGAWQPDAVRSP